MKHPRLAFLFGAGASVEAGLPALVRLTQEVRQTLPPRLGSLFDKLSATERIALDSTPANVEDVLTAADSLAAARLVHGDAGPRDYAFLAHEVRKRIWHRLTAFSRTAYLDPLKDWIQADHRLEVFSLNNDCVVETWCKRDGIAIFDGFGTNRRLDPHSFRNDTTAVQLIKLHGSVDWTEEPRKGIVQFRRPYVWNGRVRNRAGLHQSLSMRTVERVERLAGRRWHRARRKDLALATSVGSGDSADHAYRLDLATWFAYRVYRDLLRGAKDVPINSPADPAIKQIGAELAADEPSLRSIRRYNAEGLLRFGQWTTSEGTVRTGGSKRTAGYSRAVALLRERLGVGQ